MADLRGEIVESQKFRADIVKWKLILCATLGVFGLGFSGQNVIPNAYLILALLPPACLYCDTACLHTNLRIRVIGKYIGADPKHDDYHYEHFAEKCGNENVFDMEDKVLMYLSQIIYSIAIVFGFAIASGNVMVLSFLLTDEEIEKIVASPKLGYIFVISGIACMILDTVAYMQYKRRIQTIIRTPVAFRVTKDDVMGKLTGKLG